MSRKRLLGLALVLSIAGCTKTTAGRAPSASRFAHVDGARAELVKGPEVAGERASALQCTSAAPDPLAAGPSPTLTVVPNTNEAQTSTYVATPPAAPVIYAGSTAAMANNYPGSVFTQGSAYGSSICTPDLAGRDAFLKFTTTGIKGVSPDVKVEISSLAASFDQTIALWDSTPMIAPRSVPMSNDTRHAAYVASMGAIDDDWLVKTAAMSSLMPGALSASAPAVLANDDVQDLGDPVGKRINVTGATNAPGVLADFPATTLGCGASDTPPDMIYKLRPSVSTTIRAALNNPSAPSFASALAIVDGSTGHPQRFVDMTPAAATTSFCGNAGFNYTPSNFTLGSGAGQVNFTTAPAVSLTCPGTITFDSTTNTWTNYCAGEPQPTTVTTTQSGGPDLAILPFASLTIGPSTTVLLIGTRAVVLAVEGAANIAGTIDASSTLSSLGAGGNFMCEASAGGFGPKGGVGGVRSAAGVGRGNGSLTPLLGGCNGSKSGYACAGNGGGVVQISSGGALTVSGTIKANGSAGDDAGCSDGGRAGGGSGGAILLEGASVDNTGSLQADAGAPGKSPSRGRSGEPSSSAAGSNGRSRSLSAAAASGGGRIYSHVVGCVPPNDTIATAASVPIGLTQTFTSPTAGLASNLASWGGCAPDSKGPDAFYRFTLTRTTNVEVSAKGTDFKHTLALFNSNMTAQACADGSSAEPSVLAKSLPAGTYYVGFKTRNGSRGGVYTLAFRDTTAGSQYATSRACSTTGSVDAPLTANTDYYIIVKGASAGQAGSYNLTVTDIGAVQAFGCGTDLSAPDAYFDFSVNAASRDVSISLNEAPGKLKGSFQLMRDVPPLDDPTNDVAVSTCQSSAFTYAHLPAGRYYVLVRGKAVAGNAGIQPAELTIRDESGMNALDCASVRSGANATITRSLAAGTTYYVGITSSNGAAGGSYRMQLRDTSVSELRAVGTRAAAVPYVPPKSPIAGTTSAGAYVMTVTDVSSARDICTSGDETASPTLSECTSIDFEPGDKTKQSNLSPHQPIPSNGAGDGNVDAGGSTCEDDLSQ